MNPRTQEVNIREVAALKNVAACMNMVNNLIDRPGWLPGIGVMYGASGLGKSKATIYSTIKTGAIRVEAMESWNRKSLMRAILLECGEREPKGTIADLAYQAIQFLGENPSRPLIIDEADKLVDKNMIELVRELHEHAQVPVLLIGEEKLPHKLQRFERVHNRVLEWLPAATCDLPDTRKLADFYMGELAISDALLLKVMDGAGGVARRIAKTFHDMSIWARNSGVANIPDDWNGRVANGQAPRPAMRKTANGRVA